MPQIARSRIPAHARRFLEHIVKLLPQTPHFVRPEKRYAGRRAWTGFVFVSVRSKYRV
jgi:hypothetical protein